MSTFMLGDMGSHCGGFFFKDFIYLFLERGDEREKERERNIDVRNIDQLLLSDASRMHRDWELNPQPRHVS